MIATSDLLPRVGRALWGAEFGAQMAVALGVQRVTVGRWLNGRERVPDGVWVELCDLLEARQLETMNLKYEAQRVL